MDKHAPDALVTGYRQLVPALNLPDPNDRHVLAAAVRGGASVIVTNNTKDFPAAALEESRSKGRRQMNLFIISSICIQTKWYKLRRRIERVFAIRKRLARNI